MGTSRPPRRSAPESHAREQGFGAPGATTGAVAESATEPAVHEAGAGSQEDERERLTIAGHLVEYALTGFDFIRDRAGDIYALPRSGLRHVALSLDELRYPLAAQYFRVHGRPASTSAWPEASQTLKGLHADAPKHDVYLRHAFSEHEVVIDLGRPDGAVVVIDARAWRVVEQSPVLFRRTLDMEEMPLPVRGGSLEPIRRMWRIPHERWGLVLAWLVITLLSRLPAPALALLGEQGTGKSVLMKLLIKLVDPGAPVGRPPGSEERLQNAALNHRVYGIDNISHLPRWLSDALAALITGESDKRRKLYTDAEPFRLNLKAAVVFTAITIDGAGPDLLERMVTVFLDVISGGDRLHESKLWAEVDEQIPALMGALYDLVAPVLAALASGERPVELPRMADYALILHALDHQFLAPDGSPSFFDFYTTKLPRFTAHEVVEGSEFATDLIAWFDERSRKPWEGSATALLREVAVRRFDVSAGGMPKIPKTADYPRTPRGVSGTLKRLAPTLRTLGIAWTPPKAGGSHKTRVHRINPIQGIPDDADELLAEPLPDTESEEWRS
jgi:hypothetical protein